MPSRAASPFCAARAATSRPAARPIPACAACPTANAATPAPAPSRRYHPPPKLSRSTSGTGNVIPPPAPSDVAQASGSAKPLDAAEAASLAAALKAVDEGRWADARAAVANFNHTLLDRIVDWSILRAAPRADADFATTWRFLRENPDWPEPEVLRRQAEDRIGPETPPTDVFRYFTAFPPLTSAGHMRRLEAAQAASPNDVQEVRERQLAQRHLPQRRRERVPQPLRPSAERRRTRSPASTASCATAGRRSRASFWPSCRPTTSRSPMRAWRWRRAPPMRRPCCAACRPPGSTSPRSSSSARSGCAAPAISTRPGRCSPSPVANQTDAWWNERNQLARDLLAAGRAADAYAVVVPHGLTKGVAFAEAEFLAGWIALRHLKKTAEAQKHFQTLHDGVATDGSKSRAAYWLGRTHEAAGRAKEATDWYGRAARFGQTFYGQLAARKLPAARRRACRAIPVATDADRQTLGGRELVTMARYLGQAGDYERTRPFLLQLARMVTAPGETALLGQLAVELKRPDVALTVAARATQSGVVLFDAAFPVVDLGATGAIERALALALTRQESAFNAAAVSSSGALGLMQLLPSTARDVAGQARRALHPGQAHARPGLQRAARQPVPGRDAAALRRLLRAGGGRLQCRPQPRGALARDAWAIRATARSTWSTGSR